MSGSEPEYDDDTPHAGSNLDNAVLVDDVDAGNGTGRHRVLSLLPADTSVRSALRQLRQPRRRSDDSVYSFGVRCIYEVYYIYWRGILHILKWFVA